MVMLLVSKVSASLWWCHLVLSKFQKRYPVSGGVEVVSRWCPSGRVTGVIIQATKSLRSLLFYPLLVPLLVVLLMLLDGD